MGYNTIKAVVMVPTESLSMFRRWMRKHYGTDLPRTIAVVEQTANLTDRTLRPKFHAVSIVCSPEMYTAIKHMLASDARTKNTVIDGRATRLQTDKQRIVTDEIKRMDLKRIDGKKLPDEKPVIIAPRIR